MAAFLNTALDDRGVSVILARLTLLGDRLG
jgi:hypothetical protein